MSKSADKDRGEDYSLGEKYDHDYSKDYADDDYDRYESKGAKEKGKKRDDDAYETREFDDLDDKPDRTKAYEQLHKTHTTEAMMRKHMDSHWYPARNASFDDHGNAQIERSSTLDHRDMAKFERDIPRRIAVAEENRHNMNTVLPENNIAVRDFAYDTKDDRHRKAPDPERDHSVTRASVKKVIDRYPKK
jgi:hypothetical protein